MFDEYNDNLNTDSFLTSKMNYITRFKNLLQQIYKNYKLLISDMIRVPRNENKIRDILVDKYLSKNIDHYKFKKEEANNLGRVDIFIQENFTEEKPEFIIECKILDNKTIDGVTGLNAEYIKNGIYRFVTEHYFLDNDFKINAMIGFVVEKLDIVQNIKSINTLTNKIFNNTVEIKQDIFLEDNNIYKSIYITHVNGEKEFIIYHQMMDFSKNIILKKGDI